MIFRLQEARKADIAIGIYGRPEEFEDLLTESADRFQKTFGAGRGSYSKFNLARLDDAAVAADVIRRAHDLKVSKHRRP